MLQLEIKIHKRTRFLAIKLYEFLWARTVDYNHDYTHDNLNSMLNTKLHKKIKFNSRFDFFSYSLLMLNIGSYNQIFFI